MKWQIMIPTVVTRGEKFQRLVDILAPQVASAGGDIGVMVLWNNYEHELSELRQAMIEEAKADYVNFIDDDDMVTDDYCEQIYPNLDGVDYVGFRVAFYQDNRKQRPVIHSLKCEKWEDNMEGFYRRVTLINPIKRELMLQAGFKDSDYRKGVPEDTTYAQAADKLPQTEYFVDKEIHIYLPTDDHAWSRFKPEDVVPPRPQLPEYFVYHPWSTKSD